MLVVITVIGIVRVRWRGRQLEERVQRLKEFRDRLTAYVDSSGGDRRAYAELTATVERIQREAGSAAVAAIYNPPYRNEVYRNYELLVNVLPALHQTISTPRWGLDEETVGHYVRILDDALNRYTGRLKEWAEQFDRDAVNPLIWFREGVRAVLLAPVFVLRSLGAWPSTRPSLVSSVLFRIVSAIVSVIILAAAVVQIVTGWDATLRTLRGWGLPIFASDPTGAGYARPNRWH